MSGCECWKLLRGAGHCSWNILPASGKVTGSHPGSAATSEKIKIPNRKITAEHPYVSEQDENLKFQFPRSFWSVLQHVPFRRAAPPLLEDVEPCRNPLPPWNKTYLSRARVLKGDFPPGGAPAWLCPWGQHPGCELLGWAPGASLVAAVRS